MKFKLIECYFGIEECDMVEIVDFPEITQEMVEDDEHIEVFEEYLKEKDLDSFSSHFKFDPAPVQKYKFYLLMLDGNMIANTTEAYCPKCAEEQFNEDNMLWDGNYEILSSTGVTFEVGGSDD